jgi:hypothetical protein
MRPKIAGVVAVIALASALAVVAAAQNAANGLPSYTQGYVHWTKLNRKRITTDRLGAHSGVKNVYASRRRSGSRFPNGTVVVKSIVRAGTKYVGQVAVMRKVNGRWRFVEYTREGASARFVVLAQGSLCLSCHVRAKAGDYVFTKG